MPESNIYIDFSVSNVSAGAENVSSELTLATPDNIGDVNLPVVVQFNVATPGFRNVVLSYTTANTISGTESVALVYYAAESTVSGFINKEVSYSIGDSVTSGTLDLTNTYITPDVLGSGIQNVYNSFIVGQKFSGGEDVLQQLWTPLLYDIGVDYEVDFVGGFKIGYARDAITTFRIISASSGTLDAVVDLTFTGYVFNDVPMDVFSSVLTASGLAVDATTISGGVVDIPLDVFASLLDLAAFQTDVFSSAVTQRAFGTESATISGGLSNIISDSFCSNQNIGALICDVDLLSLKISNFSLAIGSWDFATGLIYADITDDVYNVTASGCYFKVDGQPVSVTSSGIVDGIRITYDPTNDFADLDGPTIITVHAENDNGDILEQDINLTLGYIVEYKNYERFGWNYGQKQQVVVRMSAENLANCPEFSADAYWFETRDIDRRELTASITGVYSYDGSNDLQASINPQSTAYFYGKVFRVKLTAKDLAGNEMEPLEFEFKIEDKP